MLSFKKHLGDWDLRVEKKYKKDTVREHKEQRKKLKQSIKDAGGAAKYQEKSLQEQLQQLLNNFSGIKDRFEDIFIKMGVIGAGRQPKPSAEEIEAAGYYYDGHGHICSKKIDGTRGPGQPRPSKHPETIRLREKYNVSILSQATGGKGYIAHNLTVPGYGSCWKQSNGKRSGNPHFRESAAGLVFLLYHRRWPRIGFVIDHIDGNKSNNHHTNLREVTYKKNTTAYHSLKDEKNGIISDEEVSEKNSYKLENFYSE